MHIYEISSLRLFGILIGSLIFLLSFIYFRGHRWNRFNFFIMTCFSAGLVAVSINPDIVNILRRMMNLEQAEQGRIIAMLICLNIIMWVLLIYFKSALDKYRYQFDSLVRSIGVRDRGDSIKEHFIDKEIAVLIPAYNEANNLKELLPNIPKEVAGHKVGILIVDDGSEDDTFTVAGNSGAAVVKNPINRGGGAALRLGYDILCRWDISICVTMDADGQHQPEDIQKLVAQISEGRYDLVIGSRILGSWERDSLLRNIGLHFFSFIISRLLGFKITDPSSGFRAFNMNILERIPLYEDQYHTSELIISAVKNRMKIGETPITISRRKFGKSKKGKDWIYGAHFAKTIIKTWWR